MTQTIAARRHPVLQLDPTITVLLRRDGTVQLGWDPETAVVLAPPDGVHSATLTTVLGMLDGNHTRTQVVWRAAENGVSTADMSSILGELTDAGLLTTVHAAELVARAIRVHGRGPLSDAIATGLGSNGVRVTRSGAVGVEFDVTRWRVDFVVLADDVVPDPRLAAGLVAAGIPHLLVRIRDGKGIVGPTVLPGRTSCLRCADLTRCDYDDEWPHIAAQMLGRVGRASPSAVMATTAMALTELENATGARAGTSPACANTTLELDLKTHRISRRTWERHPLCGCDAATC